MSDYGDSFKLGVRPRKRSELLTTNTLEKAIAAGANMGSGAPQYSGRPDRSPLEFGSLK